MFVKMGAKEVSCLFWFEIIRKSYAMHSKNSFIPPAIDGLILPALDGFVPPTKNGFLFSTINSQIYLKPILVVSWLTPYFAQSSSIFFVQEKVVMAWPFCFLYFTK